MKFRDAEGGKNVVCAYIFKWNDACILGTNHDKSVK